MTVRKQSGVLESQKKGYSILVYVSTYHVIPVVWSSRLIWMELSHLAPQALFLTKVAATPILFAIFSTLNLSKRLVRLTCHQ